MIYVKRNENNQIMEVSLSAQDDFTEASIFDAEIKDFFQKNSNTKSVQNIILELDLGMARIAEDLIDTLIENKALLFTDLPEAVQNKLNFKKMLRDQLNNPEKIDEEEELRF